MADPEKPDRILILRRGDFRMAIPLLELEDPTPLGILVSALPLMIRAQLQRPDAMGAPLTDDAHGVLMLQVPDTDRPLIPDVGLFAQTEGKWVTGGQDNAVARSELTARVPELELDVVDVDRPSIVLGGAVPRVVGDAGFNRFERRLRDLRRGGV